MRNYDMMARVGIETSKDDKTKPKDAIEVISALHISESEPPYPYRQPIPISLASNGYMITFEEAYPYLYFEDQVNGSKMIVDYVADLFNLEIYGLEIDRWATYELDWINELQEKTLVRFEFMVNSSNDSFGNKSLDYVLRNAPASEYCILQGNVSNNFRFDGKLGPANHLFIQPNGHWVTLDNLINFDAISIVVRRCRLSVSDLYSFIRHWRTGGSRRLTFLRLEFENRRIFENFQNEFEVVGRDISGEYRLSDGESWHFDHGYNIQRNDGVKAVIDFGADYFVMMVCIGDTLYDQDNYLKENSDQQFLLHQNV
ncbi:hypothetical protein B9Z55_015923 [Caenorhabditis nigoni]|nr:hypothetical protein B9Z55_015923 [Caenorhabditis nigoni]